MHFQTYILVLVDVALEVNVPTRLLTRLKIKIEIKNLKIQTGTNKHISGNI